ncbi:hypothetical protein CRX72_28940 [Pantoea sp. BRM17]|nr:hypothetical protein CRX72_28940 [Pantoea sp. BRM17]
MLRRLEALLAVADENSSLIISGNGDVIQPENDLIAIGSGGPYAQAAARALLENTDIGAHDIVEKAATLGNTVMKGNVKKVRRLYNDKVIAGFAGGTADAFTLFELFERKLEMHQGHLVKAAVELAKDWRTDQQA